MLVGCLFADGSVDVIFAMHVVHHIAQPRPFLAELQRVLKPGGALVAVEPFWSPMARLLYTYAHPEAFDRSAETWEFESSGAMSSNQAMTYLFLEARPLDLHKRVPRPRNNPFAAVRGTILRANWRNLETKNAPGRLARQIMGCRAPFSVVASVVCAAPSLSTAPVTALIQCHSCTALPFPK